MFATAYPSCHARLRTNIDLQEKRRQKHFINLIPSENFTSQAVLDALGSVMQSTSAMWKSWARGQVN
jgi:glycine/serine hydroxymethyltransferase